MKDVAQREAVLLRQRNIQSIVSGRGLKLEIKAAAKAFSQSQSPGFVDPRTERSVDDQLHPTAFVEKAFGDDRALRGDIAKHGAAFENVLDGLGGAGFIETALLRQPSDRIRDAGLRFREGMTFSRAVQALGLINGMAESHALPPL